MIKVGDKVLLITLDEAINRFGAGYYEGEAYDINTPVTCVRGMHKYLGGIVTVSGLQMDDMGENCTSFTIEEDPWQFYFDVGLVAEVNPEKVAEERKMKEFIKKCVEIMVDKINDWNTPTTGERVQMILEMVHSGYMDSDRAAELIANVLKEDN